MTTKDHKGFLLHLSVFIAGFTGVLGRLIELDPVVLVLHRMTWAAALMALFLLFRKEMQQQESFMVFCGHFRRVFQILNQLLILLFLLGVRHCEDDRQHAHCADNGHDDAGHGTGGDEGESGEQHITIMMPQAPVFCVAVIPPRR